MVKATGWAFYKGDICGERFKEPHLAASVMLQQQEFPKQTSVHAPQTEHRMNVLANGSSSHFVGKWRKTSKMFIFQPFLFVRR